MRVVNCERCGREVETDCMGVKKCAGCENIKFDRASLVPVEKQFNLNFRDVLQSDLGPVIKALYMFGSYAAGKPQCGDIDYLIITDEWGLKSLIKEKINGLHSRFDDFDGVLEQSEYQSFVEEGFWDYRTCSEYPDCLECYGAGKCKLPKTDYTASLHTYCLEKCKIGIPDPDCLYTDCYFLEREIRDHIFKGLLQALTGGIEYKEYAPGRKVKVIDIIRKNSVEELIEEFQNTGIEIELKIVEIWKR